VQTKEFESPALLPALDALDAEFGCEEQQCAPEPTRRRKEGASLDSTFKPIQSEFTPHLRATRSTVDASMRPSADATVIRPSLARRALRGLARLLIVFSIGVGTTLAWQLYGDAARAMIASSSSQLGWLAPQTAPVVPTAPDVVPPAAAALPDLEQLALGLAAVRQSVDQLTAQLAAGQQQMGTDIAKLQADEQAILHKLSAAPPRAAAAPAHKPSPVTPPPAPSAQAR